MNEIREKVKEIVENAIIASYKKLRERPNMPPKEFLGLFINYLYRGTNIHEGLSTQYDFSIFIQHNIWCIKIMSEGYHSYSSSLKTYIAPVLVNMTFSDFYALYLRSSFENPSNSTYENIDISQEITNTGLFLKDRNKEYTGW